MSSSALCVLTFRAKTVHSAERTRKTLTVISIAGPASRRGSTVKPMIDFLVTILNEMSKGNFSFLILVVGVMQLIVMWRKK